MLPLLLGLGTATSRRGHIDAILGHDLEARNRGLYRLGRILHGRLLGPLRDAVWCASVSRGRGQADRAVTRVGKGHGGGGRWGEEGWAEA